MRKTKRALFGYETFTETFYSRGRGEKTALGSFNSKGGKKSFAFRKKKKKKTIGERGEWSVALITPRGKRYNEQGRGEGGGRGFNSRRVGKRRSPGDYTGAESSSDDTTNLILRARGRGGSRLQGGSHCE